MNFTRRVALVTAMVTVIATLSVGAASAETDPLIEDPSDGLELFGADPEMAALIADTLLALEIDEAAVEEIVAAVGHGASLRLGVMLDDGVLTEEQLDALSAQVEDGDLPADLARVVEETRARRDAFREAAEELLADMGVDLDPDAPVRDTLIDNGIDPSDFIARLPEELPPPPVPDSPPEPGDPTTPNGDEPPAPRPAPPTTTTTAPPPPPPAADYPTQEPAPDHEYPTTTTPPPPPPPAGDYPVQEPAPEHEYPETSGGGSGGDGDEGEESY